MRKTALLSGLFAAALCVFFIARSSYAATFTTYSGYDGSVSFQADLGGRTVLTQDFNVYTHNQNLNGVEFLPGVSVTSNMDTITAWDPSSTGDANLFARDTVAPNTRATQTRTYYDINFTSDYKAVGFNIDAWNPDAIGSGLVQVVFADGTSTSKELHQLGMSESDPVFFGIIADTPIVRIRWNEPPEVSGSGWEETALDDFVVAPERPLGALPTSGCKPFFSIVNDKGVTEAISAQVSLDTNGCIIENSVTFYKTVDCTGDPIVPVFNNPEAGFVYKSGTRGGCPEAVEVTQASPACVTLTLQSGRETTICW